MTTTPVSYYTNLAYVAIPPQSDNDDLASKGRRLIVRHQPGRAPVLLVATKGVLTAGWVIGLEVTE